MATDGRVREDVKYGVDVSGHREFIDWMAEHPDDATLEFRATGVGEETANRTTATIADFGLGGEDAGGRRDHTLRFGLPVELEEAMAYTDAVDRYEAIEGALAGLTACINGTIQFNALREGVDVEGVTTTVRIPTDLRLLFGVHDLDRADEMFGDLAIDVDVTGDLTDEELERVREYPYRSPVYNLVTGAHPSDPNVTVRSS